MVAEHGGGAESERKAAWPEAVSHGPEEPSGGPDGGEPQVPSPQQDAGRGATSDTADEAEDGHPLDSDAYPDGEDLPGAAGPRIVGIAGLSMPYQVVAALALALVGALGAVHLAMVFLHVAPSNTLTKQHGEAIDEWVYPEFEQNWKLFAPNPLQQNVSVHVRAEVAGDEGRRTTPWMSLSSEDGEAIRGSLLPSHVDQNELRRGWDFYLNSHDSENRPNGVRGDLSERYVRRIVMLRLSEHDYGGTVDRIQVRSSVRSVPAPPWSEEKISTRPHYRVLPWWSVTSDDLPEADAPARASRASRAEETDK
ncbi:DUF5819 family protein [Streptomyces fulvorobeus]|nr:DUF5819 family protein [Streptomyces fulvorobeus]NYE41788.1 hypothetical protein [Streptomyces fulvorobeus]